MYEWDNDGTMYRIEYHNTNAVSCYLYRSIFSLNKVDTLHYSCEAC